MIKTVLKSLGPDQHALFWEIARHVTDDMLEEISRADYGIDADKHLTALRRLRDTGELEAPLHWNPFEVLELIRHDEPGNSSRWPARLEVRGHWIRAFACAALLRALGPPWEHGGDAAQPAYNLIHIVRSIAGVPAPLGRETIRFIAWFMLRDDPERGDGQVVCFGVALLWMLLQLDEPPADEELIQLAEWIIQREEELHKESPSAFDRWLLGVADDPPPSPWESLGADMLKLDLGAHRLQLQEYVHLIGAELAGDSEQG